MTARSGGFIAKLQTLWGGGVEGGVIILECGFEEGALDAEASAWSIILSLNISERASH
jgi:hypothetical protein